MSVNERAEAQGSSDRLLLRKMAAVPLHSRRGLRLASELMLSWPWRKRIRFNASRAITYLYPPAFGELCSCSSVRKRMVESRHGLCLDVWCAHPSACADRALLSGQAGVADDVVQLQA